MLTISNYHYIREDFTAKHPSIFGVTPKQFRAQLEELARHGSFISQDELIEFRDRPFEKNHILITFDDGLREQYELAKPILDKMGIPFIFFINTSNFQERSVSLVHKIHLLRSQFASSELLEELKKESNKVLTEKEKALAVTHYNYDERETAVFKYLLNFKLSLAELQAFINPFFNKIYDEEKLASELYFDQKMLQNLHQQNSLGSHSHHHLPLGRLPHQQLKAELKQTQDFFLKSFGRTADSISYPYGSFEACEGISPEVKAAGFKLGFSMERAANFSLKEDPFLLSRFDCNDLPLGKNNLFQDSSIFQKPPLRKWHTYESSFTYKR